MENSAKLDSTVSYNTVSIDNRLVNTNTNATPQPAQWDFDSVKDSGAREEFNTGSVRDTRVGKGRYDLIPILPLRRLAKHYENGAAKYGDRNWEKGQPSSRYYDSAMRHLTTYMAGDRSEDHLAAVAWNAFAMIFNEEHRPDLNDIDLLMWESK